jgi:hypothetical protein
MNCFCQLKFSSPTKDFEVVKRFDVENQVAEFQNVENITDNVELIWPFHTVPQGVRCPSQVLGDSQVVSG